MTVKISASILGCNFAHLGDEIVKVTKAGVDFIHLDIMDGHFVPNITFGVPIIKCIRELTEVLFDAHLMIANPLDFIETFASIGCDYITIHAEAVNDLEDAINKIHACGVKAGIAIKPETDASVLKPVIEKIDLILVMSVSPGFGGQEFMIGSLSKIEKIRAMINESNNKNIILSVDGGINNITARQVIEAGVDMIVAGKAIFAQKDYKSAVEELRLTGN